MQVVLIRIYVSLVVAVSFIQALLLVYLFKGFMRALLEVEHGRLIQAKQSEFLIALVMRCARRLFAALPLKLSCLLRSTCVCLALRKLGIAAVVRLSVFGSLKDLSAHASVLVSDEEYFSTGLNSLPLECSGSSATC